MNKIQAAQIATLLNIQNYLTTRYDAEIILHNSDRFVMRVDKLDNVVGAAEVKKVQWYQAEITHVSVSPEEQNKGVGHQLVEEAEHRAVSQGARIAQCTIRDNNIASIKLFLSLGYKSTITFVNNETGNRVMVFQKVLQ